MTRNIELQRLVIPEDPERRHRLLARRVQQLVRADFESLGIDEAAARSIADPRDDNMIDRQVARIQHPPVRGTRYLGVYEEGRHTPDDQSQNMEGVIKLGPWLSGDERQFGRLHELRERAKRGGRSVDGESEGLHVMAVRRDLVRVALQAARAEVVPGQSLKAAVHIDDHTLQKSFTTLSAPTTGPIGRITHGHYTGEYQLRELPPLSDK